jgi:hypothetical protein
MSKPRAVLGKVPGIPSKFQLAGFTWTVEFVPQSQQEDLGLTHRDLLKITIRDNLLVPVAQSTFWHELLHAVEFMRGRQEHDEIMIDSLALFLHQFWLTNDMGQQ